MAAPKHPGFHDACQQAARKAYDAREEGRSEKGYNPPCYGVYFDGEAMYVRATHAAQPANSVLVCIAQHWNRDAVQLRFNGANSTWMEFWHEKPGEIEGRKEKLA